MRVITLLFSHVLDKKWLVTMVTFFFLAVFHFGNQVYNINSTLSRHFYQQWLKLYVIDWLQSKCVLNYPNYIKSDIRMLKSKSRRHQNVIPVLTFVTRDNSGILNIIDNLISCILWVWVSKYTFYTIYTKTIFPILSVKHSVEYILNMNSMR